MDDLQARLTRWRDASVAAFAPFAKAPPRKLPSDEPLEPLAQAYSHAAALGTPSRGPKDLVGWAARFGFTELTVDAADEDRERLERAQASILSTRDRFWERWLPVIARSLPAPTITREFGERRAARFLEEIAAALASAKRVDTLPELVRLSGSASDRLRDIVAGFAHGSDDAFALLCSLSDLLPAPPRGARSREIKARHGALLTAIKSRAPATEALASNEDPVAVLAVLALERPRLAEFVQGLPAESREWLLALVPTVQARLSNAEEPRPGTPDHLIRARLYTFVLACPPGSPFPPRLETQAATYLRNELKGAAPKLVAEALAAVDAARRVDQITRSLDSSDPTFDVERARALLLWCQGGVLAADEQELLRSAPSKLGEHLDGLAVELFLASSAREGRVPERVLEAVKLALGSAGPSARDELIRRLEPVFGVVVEQLAPRLAVKDRMQLVRSSGPVVAHHAGRLAELAVAAPEPISWEEIDLLLPHVEGPELVRFAKVLGRRVGEEPDKALGVALQELARPGRPELLGAAAEEVIPALMLRAPREMGRFLRAIEGSASHGLIERLWSAGVSGGAADLRVLAAYAEAGGVPSSPSIASLPAALAEDLAGEVTDRIERNIGEIALLAEARAERAAASWARLKEGVAGAANDAAAMLLGTAWDPKPFRVLGGALLGEEPTQAEEDAGDLPSQAARQLPFDQAVDRAIGEVGDCVDELERLLPLATPEEGDWTDARLAAFESLLRLIDARSTGDRKLEAVELLEESLFSDALLRAGLRALVGRTLEGAEVGAFVSRLSRRLQVRVGRAAVGDESAWLNGHAAAPALTGWKAWLAGELGLVGPAPEAGAASAAAATPGWDRVRELAEEHRRTLRDKRAALTLRDRAEVDALRSAAELLRFGMEEIELALRAYETLRLRLAEVGLEPAVDLVHLRRRRAELASDAVRLPGSSSKWVEIRTGGFRQPGGPVLVQAEGVPREDPSGEHD